MSIVVLTSGGMDSTLMAVMAKEEGIDIHPLFVNYKQLARERELAACIASFKELNLPEVKEVDLSGMGELIRCGLTDPEFDIKEQAFLPGRNLLFLLVGASYAYQVGANGVAIGLLNEEMSIFPDQTKSFVEQAQNLLSFTMDWPIEIITPLMEFDKEDIVALAKEKGITNTYSCHAGTEEPCGVCIACQEYQFN
ncbi:MAG: 7-cyano-7-deazaguanine synthase [Candidatus Thiodiazotropha sp.]